MSQENVELVRALYEAFNRGDYASAAQHLHSEGEVYPGVGGSRLCGRDEVRQFFEDLGETWEAVTVEFEEVTETPDGGVLAVERWLTRGRGGIEVVTTIIDVYAVRDGLIVRVDGFRDKAEALEAVGLSE